jgi:hypothetical protein
MIRVGIDVGGTLLTDRKLLPPYGLADGELGKFSENRLIRSDQET